MSKILKFLIGLILLIPSLLCLVVYIDPEMPVRVGMKWSEAPEPFATAITRWFEFANFIQNANTAEYLGYLILFFGLAVAGFFTCLKST